MQATEPWAGCLFDIRPCTEQEALEVLRDPSVLPFLAFEPVGVRDVEKYLLGSALVIVMPQGNSAEVHIACKYRDRGRVRGYFKTGLDWLRIRGFKEVFTTAPEHRTALINMLKALDFQLESGRWVHRWE